MRSFARTWTNDLRERRIRVNVLSPGHIDTPIMESLQQGEALVQMKKQMENNIPLGRLGEPEEIARAVSFLHPMMQAISRAQSFSLMEAWPKFELCQAAYVRVVEGKPRSER